MTISEQEAAFHTNYGKYIARHMFVWAGSLPHEDKQKLLKWERSAYDWYDITRSLEGFYSLTFNYPGSDARARTVLGRHDVSDGVDLPWVQASVLQAAGRDA